jgi:hypothetical protein
MKSCRWSARPRWSPPRSALKRGAGLVTALLCAVALPAISMAAQESERQPPEASQPTSFSFRTSLKSSLLGSRAPDDPELFPQRESAVSYWRARFEPTVRFGSDLRLDIAYEQRVRVFNQAPGLAGSGILPDEAPAPYRVRQLDWALSEHSGLAWRHEIDRAYLAWHLPVADLTVGRQAIGWGRGVVFGAVDLFAPFSPLEADREWRRGVDAVRVEVPLADRVSADAVAAFGESVDESAFAGRVRGYAGNVDLEVVGGRRGQDLFLGVTSSAAVHDAEIHGEAVVFRARDTSPVRAPAQAVAKIVTGTSYRFGLGPGILTFVEYHYSGFGVARPEDIVQRLAVQAFIDRLLRGDTQILGRHALAVLASSELSPELALGTQWLHSPTDGSGVIAPTGTFTFSDKVSLVANVYLPYGRPPAGTTLKSQFGAAALSGFVQLRIYL